MKFIDLPEPHVSCSHVLKRLPMLYRFDARSVSPFFDSGSVVVTENEQCRPTFDLNGNPATIRTVYRRAVKSMLRFEPDLIKTDPTWNLPIWTLDLRPADYNYQAFVSGFDDDAVRVVQYGRAEEWRLWDDIAQVARRLDELGDFCFRK